MQYRTDPRSGNKLSVLGFGCMRFSGSLRSSFGFGIGKGYDEKKIEKLLVDAVDKGINYFDTAYLYAGSESFLGSTLQLEYKRMDCGKKVCGADQADRIFISRIPGYVPQAS